MVGSVVAARRWWAPLTLGLLVLAGVTGPVQAASTTETVAYEGFDYTAGSGLVDGQSGGVGWSGPWEWTYGAGSSLQVASPGLGYPGLSVAGGRAAFYQRPGGNQISQAGRPLARQSDGIVYVQVLTSGIANSNGSSGAGTPRIQLTDGGTTTAWLGGNGVGAASMMALLDGTGGTQLITSSAALSSADLMTILRIDYGSGTTSMWTNPDLTAFDYADPPPPDGTVAQAFTFDRIDIYLRAGSIDEVRVLRPVPPSEDLSQRPPDWIREYARSESDTCAERWSPSWAQWPGDGAGGYVCRQVLTWSHAAQGFVVRP